MKIVIISKGWFKQKWSFQFVSNNGNILVSSEKYANKVDMLNTITLIKAKLGKAEVEYKYPEK